MSILFPTFHIRFPFFDRGPLFRDAAKHIVPAAALEALADSNIPFTVQGETASS
jgi:hypothetical protein